MQHYLNLNCLFSNTSFKHFCTIIAIHTLLKYIITLFGFIYQCIKAIVVGLTFCYTRKTAKKISLLIVVNENEYTPDLHAKIKLHIEQLKLIYHSIHIEIIPGNTNQQFLSKVDVYIYTIPEKKNKFSQFSYISKLTTIKQKILFNPIIAIHSSTYTNTKTAGLSLGFLAPYIWIDFNSQPTLLAHEVTHTLGIFAHHLDPKNLMHHTPPLKIETANILTAKQKRWLNAFASSK